MLIKNQQDINDYKNCTNPPSLSFGIDHSFKGPFNMTNVTTLPEFMNGYYLPKLQGLDRVDDETTTVSMPDLETVGGRGVLFGYMNNLTSISLP